MDTAERAALAKTAATRARSFVKKMEPQTHDGGVGNHVATLATIVEQLATVVEDLAANS